MFKRIKAIFSEPILSFNITSVEDWYGTRSDDHEFGESLDGLAHIRQMKNGKFRLIVNQNEVVGTYARKRDAVRGATRKGLTVVL